MGNHAGDAYWYINIMMSWLGGYGTSWSNSWTVAQDLADFEWGQGATFLSYFSQSRPARRTRLDGRGSPSSIRSATS